MKTPEQCPIPKRILAGYLRRFAKKYSHCEELAWRAYWSMQRVRSHHRIGEWIRREREQRVWAWRWQFCANMWRYHFGETLKNPCPRNNH